MARIDDMLKRAEECERLADRSLDAITAVVLRETAQQLRTVAVHIDLLERDPSYLRIRNRTEQARLGVNKNSRGR